MHKSRSRPFGLHWAALAAVLVTVATDAAAAPTGDVAVVRKERLASIELAVDAKGGAITTEAEFLGGDAGRYRFGSPCGTTVAEPVLQQMFAALADGRFVQITAEGTGEARCVTRLTFYSP